jgi:phage regulator Rha-like protein
MEELVELYHGKEPRVSTFKIYEKFGYKEHRTFKRVVSDNVEDFKAQGFLHLQMTKPLKGTKGGRPEESYLLNEDQFILLVVLAKNTPASVELKVRVVNEFKSMRNRLAKLSSLKQTKEYIETRESGKVIYHQKTDVIKQFVDYATGQGSKNAKQYYSNLAKMENSALFFLEQKFPNVREFLNIRQLMQVSFADQVIDKALLEGMENGLDYHAIFDLAKERVIMVSSTVGKSQVIAMQELSNTPQLENP